MKKGDLVKNINSCSVTLKIGDYCIVTEDDTFFGENNIDWCCLYSLRLKRKMWMPKNELEVVGSVNAPI